LLFTPCQGQAYIFTHGTAESSEVSSHSPKRKSSKNLSPWDSATSGGRGRDRVVSSNPGKMPAILVVHVFMFLLCCTRTVAAASFVLSSSSLHRPTQPHSRLLVSPRSSAVQLNAAANDDKDDDEIAKAFRRRDEAALASEWNIGDEATEIDDDMGMLRERIDLYQTKERDLEGIRQKLLQFEAATGVKMVGDDGEQILPTAWVFVGVNLLAALYALKVLLVDPATASLSLLPAASAADAPVAVEGAATSEASWFYKYVASPGLEIEYGEYMDASTGRLIYPIEGTKLTSSGPLLLLGAGATRLGGILPDEMPFNIVQKVLRAIPGVRRVIPDLRDDDTRKQYQDTWYGTDLSASLPKVLRSRRQDDDGGGSGGGGYTPGGAAAGAPAAGDANHDNNQEGLEADGAEADK
jgi:hypothetical protein